MFHHRGTEDTEVRLAPAHTHCGTGRCVPGGRVLPTTTKKGTHDQIFFGGNRDAVNSGVEKPSVPSVPLW